MIRTEHLCKTYFSGEVETKALVDVNIEIEKGQFLSITGKSGSGKSTLLHILSLLDDPTEGKVFVDNEDTSLFSYERQGEFRLNRFGYIFQDYALVPELTAEDNVVVPLLMQGLSKKEAEDIAKQVLDRVGLAKRFDNLPSQLSGGEQQRVSIARAISNKPEVIFADEPTANLDSETSKVVLDYFQELNKEGQTIVMVTHEDDYSRIAHRILSLSDGKIISDKKT